MLSDNIRRTEDRERDGGRIEDTGRERDRQTVKVLSDNIRRTEDRERDGGG